MSNNQSNNLNYKPIDKLDGKLDNKLDLELNYKKFEKLVAERGDALNNQLIKVKNQSKPNKKDVSEHVFCESKVFF